MNSNLENLMNDLDNKATNDLETNADNYIEAPLTDEDRATIEKMKGEATSVLAVTETGADGEPVTQPISEYAKSLDTKVKSIEENSIIKTVNSGDIVRNAESMKSEVRDYAMKAYRDLAYSNNQELTDADILKINDDAIHAIMEYAHVDRLTNEVIDRYIKKLSLQDMIRILPDSFVHLYLSDQEILANHSAAKSRLLATLDYLCVTGPEMDYLNEYIEDENKLAMVSKRLLQCQMDFAEMLKDPAAMSELISRTVEMAPLKDTFWQKYIKFPNRVHNEFAQRYVIQQKYMEAYTKLLEDYPVEGDDISDHDKAVNQKARSIIETEIREAKNKMEVYRSISDLDLLKELYALLDDRYRNNVKLSLKFLIKEGIAATDRAKRSKQNIPFPGYKGGSVNEKTLFSQYIKAYSKMLETYNQTLTGAIQKAKDAGDITENTDISMIGPVKVDGISDEVTFKVFSLVMVILMGRVLRKLAVHDCTKYDAIIIDSYYQIFCRLGTDMYLMSEVWTMCKPLVEFLIQNVRFDQKW